MTKQITESEIRKIVENVIKGVSADAGKKWTSTEYMGRRLIGVYTDMNEAIDAAEKGYFAVRAMTVEQREKIITEIRRLTVAEAQTMAEIGVAETGMGRVDHKRLKHLLVAEKTPGTEDIVSEAKTGDNGLTLVEMAPFGVVGAITPSTNPSETVICNSIGMIAAGNGVVFNPHPNAICTSNYAVDLVNRASRAAGGPEVLVCSMDKPTLESASIMQSHPKVRLLVCTGGPGVVKAVLSSGKKAIGAGAGNPPVIVDDTAWDYRSCISCVVASDARPVARMRISPIPNSARCPRSRKRDWRPSVIMPSSVQASKLRCAIWKFAARVICLVHSSTDTWMRSATICTSSCSTARCWRRGEHLSKSHPSVPLR